MSELEVGKLCLPVFASGYTTDEANFLPCLIPDMSLIHLVPFPGPTSPQTSADSCTSLDIAENLKPTLLSSGQRVHVIRRNNAFSCRLTEESSRQSFLPTSLITLSPAESL